METRKKFMMNTIMTNLLIDPICILFNVMGIIGATKWFNGVGLCIMITMISLMMICPVGILIKELIDDVENYLEAKRA